MTRNWESIPNSFSVSVFQTLPNQYGQQSQTNQYNSQQVYGQQQQLPGQTQIPQQYQQADGEAPRPPSSTSIRRNSRVLTAQDRPNTIGQTLNDRSLKLDDRVFESNNFSFFPSLHRFRSNLLTRSICPTLQARPLQEAAQP